MQTANLCERAAGDKQHPELRRLMSAVTKLAGQPETIKPRIVGIDLAPGETPSQLYWRAFQTIAESHGRLRKAPKEVRGENYYTPLERPPGFEVYASAFIT